MRQVWKILRLPTLPVLPWYTVGIKNESTKIYYRITSDDSDTSSFCKASGAIIHPDTRVEV